MENTNGGGINFVKHWQQSLLRVGVNYKVHPQVTLHVGYAWIETFPYGTYTLASVPKKISRTSYLRTVGGNSQRRKQLFCIRVRLEQRWLGRFASLNTEKPATFSLTGFDICRDWIFRLTSKWYAAVYDEIFIGFGKNVGENVFDQNRIGALIGYKANKNFRIEGGFLNQTVQLGREIERKNVFQYNNGLIVNTYTSIFKFMI